MADTEKIIRKKYDVPIWHKSNLTIDEAVEYSGIGRERLRKLTSQEECPFVLHIGNRRMIKRRIFDEYIEKLISHFTGSSYHNSEHRHCSPETG